MSKSARNNAEAKADRDARIMKALRAGEKTITIADREGFPLDEVKKMATAAGIPKQVNSGHQPLGLEDAEAMRFNRALADYVEALQKKLGNRVDVAAAIGVPIKAQTTILDWNNTEKIRYNWTLASLVRLAHAADMSLEDLLEDILKSMRFKLKGF